MLKTMGHYCGRYTVYAVVTMAVIYGIMFAIADLLPNVAARLFADGSGSGIGSVALILPPFLVGQQFFKVERQHMPSGFGWRLAAFCTAICIAVSVALTLVLRQFDPATAVAMSELGASVAENWILAVVSGVVLALIIFLITRLFLWAGLRFEIRKTEREAIKAATKG